MLTMMVTQWGDDAVRGGMIIDPSCFVFTRHPFSFALSPVPLLSTTYGCVPPPLKCHPKRHVHPIQLKAKALTPRLATLLCSFGTLTKRIHPRVSK